MAYSNGLKNLNFAFVILHLINQSSYNPSGKRVAWSLNKFFNDHTEKKHWYVAYPIF